MKGKDTQQDDITGRETMSVRRNKEKKYKK